MGKHDVTHHDLLTHCLLCYIGLYDYMIGQRASNLVVNLPNFSSQRPQLNPCNILSQAVKHTVSVL